MATEVVSRHRSTVVDASQLAEQLVQDHGAVKLRAIEGAEVQLTGIGGKKENQYGMSAPIYGVFLDGENEGQDFTSYVTGHLMDTLTVFFTQNKNRQLQGRFLLSPWINGAQYRGWQFVGAGGSLSAEDSENEKGERRLVWRLTHPAYQGADKLGQIAGFE